MVKCSRNPSSWFMPSRVFCVNEQVLCISAELFGIVQKQIDIKL